MVEVKEEGEAEEIEMVVEEEEEEEITARKVEIIAIQRPKSQQSLLTQPL